MKILIMGLPGSGKTTLAKALQTQLACPWINADNIRSQFDDWDFSYEGRIRQAYRMRDASECLNNTKYILVDFVAPTEEIRKIFSADFTIWMNTITQSKYSDTNQIFETPTTVNVEITDFNYDIEDIIKKL